MTNTNRSELTNCVHLNNMRLNIIDLLHKAMVSKTYIQNFLPVSKKV